MKCPICEGEGEHLEYWLEGSGGVYNDCGLCEGDGQITLWEWLRQTFWHNAPIWFVEWYGEILEDKNE